MAALWTSGEVYEAYMGRWSRLVAVEHAATHVADARADFRVADAAALPVPDGAADVVVSGLVLNFVADPRSAAREMHRVLVPGGGVGCYVWDYAGGMQMLRHFWDVAAALDPASREADQGERFEICRPEALRSLLADAGFRDVLVDEVVVPTVFTDFEDYWSPFLAGRAPAPSYVMALTVDDREALRAALHAALPTRADGSIHLTARAWVVSGAASG